MATSYTYKVKSGDTLWGICSGSVYTAQDKNKLVKDVVAGNTTREKINTLVKLNNIADEDLIHVNQTLQLNKQASVSNATAKPKITQIGWQAKKTTNLFVVWAWDKDNSKTQEYNVVWEFATGDGVWFEGGTGTVQHDTKNYVFSPSDIATKIRVKVTVIAKTHKSKGEEVKYFSDKTCSWYEYNLSNKPPQQPAAPSIDINENMLLKVTYNNVKELNATHLEFQIVKNDTSNLTLTEGSSIVEIKKEAVTFTYTVTPGNTYKVRCRSVKGDQKSSWSDYSENKDTRPAAPSKITTLRAENESTVFIEWSAVANATGYTVQYRDASYGNFSISTTEDKTASPEGANNNLRISGLTPGTEYIFRVRASNVSGDSKWSTDVKSVVVGKEPAQPTTWSSATSASEGGSVTLYWMHNSVDGSKQESAVIQLIFNKGKGEENGEKTVTVTLDIPKDHKEDEAGFLVITDSEVVKKECMNKGEPVVLLEEYTNGVTITWCVKTAGILTDSSGNKIYSEFSTERMVTVYAKPYLSVKMVDSNGVGISTLTAFPFTIEGSVVNKDGYEFEGNQTPVSYDVSIRSTANYETVDDVGNRMIVNNGDAVYSTSIDTDKNLSLTISAGDVDLENGVMYEVICTVYMDSGLSAETRPLLKVIWDDVTYEPDMDIEIDKSTYSAILRPYCYQTNAAYYKVVYDDTTGSYSRTDELIDPVDGLSVTIDETVTDINGNETTVAINVYLSTGEMVFEAEDGTMFAIIERGEDQLVENVTLSVYRRDFDGKYTEIATGLPNSKFTYVIDPHPALDYARYRVVAMSTITGTIGYTDTPALPVGGSAIILQWNDVWTSYTSSTEDTPVELKPGVSMLKLPYNIDVSSSYGRDVAHIEYIGREHPVSYFGTQLGESCNLSADVDATDKETLYALRRLATWMGNVYVRTPTGLGYWATVEVSFNENHMELVVPVSIAVTRVEGGI